jgi:hypothetical protein
MPPFNASYRPLSILYSDIDSRQYLIDRFEVIAAKMCVFARPHWEYKPIELGKERPLYQGGAPCFQLRYLICNRKYGLF